MHVEQFLKAQISFSAQQRQQYMELPGIFLFQCTHTRALNCQARWLHLLSKVQECWMHSYMCALSVVQTAFAIHAKLSWKLAAVETTTAKNALSLNALSLELHSIHFLQS